MNEPILYSVDDHVATITLNRPDRHNALSIEMRRQWVAVLEAFNSDPEVRAGVLTGAGEAAFCAGVDLREMSERDKQGKPRAGSKDVGMPLLPTKPLVAAINGHCLAGGLELALLCDIRVASRTASFALPEVKRCLIPKHAVNRLPALIPRAAAAYLLLSGETMNADKALAIGLVHEVLPSKGEAQAVAFRIARSIAKSAPMAVQEIQALLNAYPGTPTEDSYRRTEEARTRLRACEDAKEGPRAFAEKRAPAWKGR